MKDEKHCENTRLALRQRTISPRRTRGSEKGTALFELAASFTLLFSILYGILGFGEGLYAYHSMTEAAREGTRYAVVRGANSPSPVTSTQMQTYVSGLLPGLNSNNVTVTTTWSPNNSPGGTVAVQVNYTFKFNLPLLPSSSVSMTATSKMVISQ